MWCNLCFFANSSESCGSIVRFYQIFYDFRTSICDLFLYLKAIYWGNVFAIVHGQQLKIITLPGKWPKGSPEHWLNSSMIHISIPPISDLPGFWHMKSMPTMCFRFGQTKFTIPVVIPAKKSASIERMMQQIAAISQTWILNFRDRGFISVSLPLQLIVFLIYCMVPKIAK